MQAILNPDGSVTVHLSKRESEDLTFEIAMTDSVWSQVPYLQTAYPNPSDAPLSALHSAIHKVWK